MRSRLAVVEALVLVLTLALGWYVALGPGATPDGRPVLIGLALAATLGSAVALHASLRRRSFLAASALVVAAVSPTGFGYLANLLVLVLALVEVALGCKRAMRTAREA